MSQHFRVNTYFMIIWAIFINCKIVLVEKFQ
ncbi:hypothetical protein Barb6XT_02758 [Bacteroidales bacterium Barb6XT]|nr:hypothetical protein Barb6XT_02758 [Bacteroidales bacterium Barb6XT]